MNENTDRKMDAKKSNGASHRTTKIEVPEIMVAADMDEKVGR